MGQVFLASVVSPRTLDPVRKLNLCFLLTTRLHGNTRRGRPCTNYIHQTSAVDRTRHRWTVRVGAAHGCLVRTCGRMVVWPTATRLDRERARESWAINKTTLVQLPLTTLGQETRSAYSTMPPSPHVGWVQWHCDGLGPTMTEMKTTRTTLHFILTTLNPTKNRTRIMHLQAPAVTNWPVRLYHAVDRAWRSHDKQQWSSVGARRYYRLSWPTTAQFITLWASTFFELSC